MGYQVSRSLRFNAADTAYLSKTFGGTGSQVAWVYSFWIKRGNNDVYHSLIDRNVSGSPGNSRTEIVFSDSTDGNHLDWYETNGAGSITARRITTRVFRDPSAWCNIVCVWDSANATAADRMRVYINGVRETAFNTATNPSSSQASNLNDNGAHYIGNNHISDSRPLDGYQTEIAFVNAPSNIGTIDATSFGKVDPVTGQWVPIDLSALTFGTNGFWLKFADNSNTTSTTLGKDSSANGNNWTPNNFSISAGAGNDSLVDTPTNYGSDTGLGGEVRGNYCTLNPLDVNYTLRVLKNGDLDITNGSGNGGSSGTLQFNSGKLWFEITVGSTTSGAFVGIGADAATNRFFYKPDGNKYSDAGGAVAYGATYATGDVIGVDLDLSGGAGAGVLTFYKQTGGSGSFVSQGAAFSTLTGPFTAACLFQATIATPWSFNFGQRPWNNSAVPAGRKAWCTQNLPAPAVPKPSNFFGKASAAAASIQTALAAARSGWTDYVEIFKRLDGAEGSIIRFSSDTANHLKLSTTAAKAAFPSLSGNYIGYAIRCDSGYPARTGTVVHTNGAASTVTHNLGNVRGAIFLKREDSTSNWFLYHPALAAGKLIYVNTSSLETTDSTITTVSANSFQIGSGTPSGTYRYLIIAEQDGLVSLPGWAGNSSADGMFIYAGMKPGFFAVEPRNLASSLYGFDTVRDPYNPVAHQSYLQDDTTTEATSTSMDFNSNGVKMRSTSGGFNNAYNYFGIAIADMAFKYSAAPEDNFVLFPNARRRSYLRS